MGTLPLNWRVPLWWEYSFPLRALSLFAPLMPHKASPWYDDTHRGTMRPDPFQ
jgi:hypothetical protein